MSIYTFITAKSALLADSVQVYSLRIVWQQWLTVVLFQIQRGLLFGFEYLCYLWPNVFQIHLGFRVTTSNVATSLTAESLIISRVAGTNLAASFSLHSSISLLESAVEATIKVKFILFGLGMPIACAILHSFRISQVTSSMA